MPGDLNNFTIRGRAQNLPDPQRSWLWQMTIFGINAIVPNVGAVLAGTSTSNSVVSEEDLRVRCRTVSIPTRDHDDIVSQFMTTKQHIWGKPIVDGTSVVTFEETNDQKVLQIFHAWQQKMVNVNPAATPAPVMVGGAGQSVADRAINLKLPIYITMYDYSGKTLMQEIFLFGAFPKTIADVNLSYTESTVLNFSVTFQFDYHLLIDGITQLPW